MSAADDPCISLIGQAEVVGVGSFAADQRVVLLARDGLADTEFLQCDIVLGGDTGWVIEHGEIRRIMTA